MGDISQVFVRGKVDETEIGSLQLDQPARITVETFKDRTFQGRVTQISPMGVERDNVTNFEVRVSIDNPGNELKANMTANAEIVLEERPNALIVPEAAINYDAKRNASVDVLDRSSHEPAQARAHQSRHQQRHAYAGAGRAEGRGQGVSCRTRSQMRQAILQSIDNLRTTSSEACSRCSGSCGA